MYRQREKLNGFSGISDYILEPFPSNHYLFVEFTLAEHPRSFLYFPQFLRLGTIWTHWASNRAAAAAATWKSSPMFSPSENDGQPDRAASNHIKLFYMSFPLSSHASPRVHKAKYCDGTAYNQWPLRESAQAFWWTNWEVGCGARAALWFSKKKHVNVISVWLQANWTRLIARFGQQCLKSWSKVGTKTSKQSRETECCARDWREKSKNGARNDKIRARTKMSRKIINVQTEHHNFRVVLSEYRTVPLGARSAALGLDLGLLHSDWAHGGDGGGAALGALRK
ncbi:hypothetical protein B0H16DRAFT_1461629 [Mycena metata]|uniref:Uncharacterized protein n=1 Tax=Mycena metata TaxID=1033252 RepID=A0AAD7IQH8_9AGAR|nr:hypothetical protein B0H16DRAFT_1461629 [Mycena metata]